MTIVQLLAAHDHDVSAFGPFEWALVGVAALFTIWVIWRAVVLTVHPDEDGADHIKRMILDDEQDHRAGGA